MRGNIIVVSLLSFKRSGVQTGRNLAKDFCHSCAPFEANWLCIEYTVGGRGDCDGEDWPPAL